MPSDETDETTNCVDQPWLCDRCEAKLAYALTDPRGVTHLRFKIRDLYITVLEPLQIRVTCRKCGWVNLLTSSHEREVLALLTQSPHATEEPTQRDE